MSGRGRGRARGRGRGRGNRPTEVRRPGEMASVTAARPALPGHYNLLANQLERMSLSSDHTGVVALPEHILQTYSDTESGFRRAWAGDGHSAARQVSGRQPINGAWKVQVGNPTCGLPQQQVVTKSASPALGQQADSPVRRSHGGDQGTGQPMHASSPNQQVTRSTHSQQVERVPPCQPPGNGSFVPPPSNHGGRPPQVRPNGKALNDGIKVITNYFCIRAKPEAVLYQYIMISSLSHLKKIEVFVVIYLCNMESLLELQEFMMAMH